MQSAEAVMHDNNHNDATPFHPASADLILDVAPRIFALFLSYIYTSTYPSSADASLAYRHAASASPEHAIPLSIQAWLLGQKLGSVGFMNYAMSRVFYGCGRYWAMSPGVVEYVWAGTTKEVEVEVEVEVKTEVKTEERGGVKIEEKEKAKGEEREEKKDAIEINTDTTTPPTPTKPSSDTETAVPIPTSPPILSPSPLRAFILSVLTTYWTSPALPYVARHERMSWEAVFDAYPDLRRDFIFGMMQANRKMLALQGYFAK
jgi:hypothetical protein